ncbi:Predicted dehydrogenase [Fodinibius roseus]|uniref:Predicted dehydrogenase n=1 Tax=Fodinibius roseus TaxID=1194090 RepID=A0A1M5D758_9BACT|nr:Gfo/Idh/MocA family oxidoreductase [Fodinibius roseus]SHF62856.1 Predicted dehydrogenase [Fodinibius roseus]
MADKVNIAIIGLGFGAEFIPIFQKHPAARVQAICQRTQSELNEVGDAFGIETRYSSYEELLEDPAIDAVHINTPIQLHAEHSLMALRAGKHVSCTVPMATSIEDCREIIDTARETGLKYMMAETVVYSREYLFVKELYDKGELGKIQYLQASHPQDMEGWPAYWERMKPMHYATHVVSPVLGLTDARAEYVSCFGSGRISEDLVEKSSSPFAVETCHIKLKDSDLSAHIYRSLFDTARQYRESFDAYGSKKSFEWPLIEGERPVIHTAKKPEPEIPERVEVPDYGHRLPEEIQEFTREGVYDAEEHAHLSFIQGGGHGGSHPHLAHEFVAAIREGRDPYPNAVEAANWTCVGLLAHESAMAGGDIKHLPDFTLD